MTKKKEKPPKKPKQLRSGFEKKVAAHLESLKVKFEYEEGRIPYTIPASNHYYVPDFTLPNGIIVEAKGNFDRIARQKMALVLEQNPDKDIRMLFMRNNKINKASKMKYSDWCDRRDIAWSTSSNGEIPEEWINESEPKIRQPKEPAEPKRPKRSARPKPLDPGASPSD